MKTFEQLAQEAHIAFCKEMKKQNSQPWPHWHQLMTSQQEAWIAATRHIVDQANPLNS